MVRPRRLCNRPRAIWDEDKASRSQDLLNGAARLFATKEFDAISVQDVCREANVAKGTFYLYFGSKEEAFLALATERLEAWSTKALKALGELPTSKGRTSARLVAEAYSRSFAGEDTLVRLLSMLHPIIERHVEPDKIAPFKRAMVGVQSAQTPAWQRLYPTWSDGHVGSLMLFVTTSVVGLWSVVNPPDSAKRAMKLIGLETVSTTFEEAFASQLAIFLTGLAQ